MILRALTLCAGLASGAVATQFPEFSQQYVQRLGGAVDALETVVADFDASALAEGLTRSVALSQMGGTAFLDRRRADMERTIARHAALSADLDALRTAGPFLRAYRAHRMTDRDVAQAALAVYQPAVPLNIVGLVFAGVGFALGMLAGGLVLQLCLWPFRRHRRA